MEVLNMSNVPNEENEVPEKVMNECFHMYNDVLTHSKKQNLSKIIRNAFISAKRLSEKDEEE